MKTQWHARFENFNDSLMVYARAESFGGLKTPVLQPMQLLFKEQDEGLYMEPALRLDGDDARALFNAMWDAGMRPNDGSGGGAEAEALRKHIAFAERMADGLLRSSTLGAEKP